MEHPIHASENVDKDETVPRIVAVVAGLVLLGIVTGGLMYSGIWAPSNPAAVATVAKH